MFQPGTVICDHYKILNTLGKGGFSQTYEVDDNGTLKVLKVLLENYSKAVALFQREAKVLSQLRHPGIPQVEADGYFTLELEGATDPIYCLVMERIPGVDLRQWMGNSPSQSLTNEQAIDWLQQIVEILAQIHQHHCFHRDIKPSNIMLRPSGQLALIDFGAVREVTETYLQKCEEDLTRTHVYSRGYTPMEQMQGRAVPESDFFALGRTFVHLMTGKNPLEFPSDANTGRLLWRDQAPQISPTLADLLDCLMAPFPGQRPHDPEAIQTALQEILANPELTEPLDGTVLSTLVHHAQSLEPSNLVGLLSITEAEVEVDITHPPLADKASQITETSVEHPLPWRQERSPLIRFLTKFAGIPLLAACSLVVTGGMMGLRFTGLLQGAELQAFDAFLHARPPEAADSRLVLITVDEPDLAYQMEVGMLRQGSLADEALYQVLEKITPHKPRVIGLDIYREAPSPSTLAPDYPDYLASQMYLQAYPNLVAVCSVGGGETDYAPIEPPPTIPLERVGFSDLPLDGDNHVRRQIVGMDAAEHCNTTQSLSYQLASRYLAQADIESFMDDQGILYLGDRPFPPLTNHTGGYHAGGLGGYEVMLNYRNTPTIAQTIPLREILEGHRDTDLADLVGDRIVLIGTTAPSFGDYHTTPYGEMAGVIVQGHMISQIVSAVLDERPLIWTWPQWADALWVCAWAVLGGSIARFGRSHILVGGGVVVLGGVGTGVAYLVFLSGGWVPLVPSVLALVIAAAAMRICKSL